MAHWAEIPFESLYLEPSKNGVNRPRSTRGSGYKMINMGELFEYDRINNPPMDLVPLNEDEKEKYGVQEGDLLFARQSLVKEGAGKCSIVLSVPETTCFEGHLIRVRLDKAKAIPSFYYYYFSSSEGKGKVQSLVMQVAAAGIRGSELAKLPVSLPPLPIQRKIADVLSAYDDLIEVNARRIRVLEAMAQSVYREWFGAETLRATSVRAKSLPRGWEQKPFGELLSYHINGGWGDDEQSEKSPAPGYVIRGTDIPNGRYGQFDKVPFRYHKQSNFASRQLKYGDIVIEIAGGSKGQPVGRALLIGQQLLNKFGNQVICASFCKMLRPNQDIVSSEYLYLHLREIYENGQIEKYQLQSTGIINFKSSFFLEDNLVTVPDKEIMEKFTQFVRPLFEMIETLGQKNANLRRTRDLLLPRLVGGRDVAMRGDVALQRLYNDDDGNGDNDDRMDTP